MYENLLRNCPICGSNDVHVAVFPDYYKKKRFYRAECAQCCCGTSFYEKSQEAIDNWNFRCAEKEYALLPCPLCGAHGEIGHYGCGGKKLDDDLYPGTVKVRCSACHFSTCSGLSLAEAVAEWNMRRYIPNVVKSIFGSFDCEREKHMN